MRKLFLLFPFLVSVSFCQECKLNIGTNIEGITDWTTSMPFVDVMKQCREWYTQNSVWVPGGGNEWNTGYIDHIPLDENGYPLYAPVTVAGAETTQVVRTIWAVVSAWPEGDYTLYYDGTGEFSFNGNLYQKNKEPGKIILGFDPPPSGQDGLFELGIDVSDSTDPVRNIRIYLPGFDTTNTAMLFNPAYTSKLEPFGTIRFMDWGRTNNWGHGNAWECYDEDSDTVRTQWHERVLPDYYTYSTNKGVPYEVMINFCNQLKKDMWICVPHSASDGYIRNLAELLKTSLHPELKIYVEYSNEIWNWMFGQTQWLYTFYCDRLGVDWPEGMVPLVQNCLDIFSEVFAGESHRIVRVVGVQGAYQDVSNRIVFNLRPSSFDTFSPAAYFGLSEEGDSVLDTLGSQAMVADVAFWARENMVENAMAYLTTQKETIADSLQLPMIYYEGGQHLTPHPFGEEPSYAQALLDIQRDTAMYDLYDQWFDFLESLVDEEENTLFMNFSFIAERSARYGSWGILEYLDQDTSEIYAPKYAAILDRIDRCRQSTDIEIGGTPDRYRLCQNYPNPFNPVTTIHFIVPNNCYLELKVYDVLGKEVDTLVEKELKAGPHGFVFDAQAMPSGVYFYRLKIDGCIQTKKMILIR